MEKIRVICDISPLGDGTLKAYKKTGIFRVAENTVDQLILRDDIELFLYPADGNFASCFVYLQMRGDWFNKYTLVGLDSEVCIRWQSINDYSISVLSDKIDSHAKLAVLYKILRKILRIKEAFLKKIFRFMTSGKLMHFAEKSDAYISALGIIPDIIKRYKNLRKYIIIYDLIPIIYPEFFKKDISGKHFLKKIIESIDEDTVAVCISECTRKDLLNFRNDLNEKNIIISHPAASGIFYRVTDQDLICNSRRNIGIPDNSCYIMCLSTLEPRKNLTTVIKAFEKVLSDNPDLDLYLVIVGPAGWKHEPVFEKINQSESLKSKVIVSGYVDDIYLAPLYSGALAFLYLSFYEGFGLPVLEAMKCGTPVITSDRSSLPEVAGDACILVDPLDIDGIAKYITDLCFNTNFKKKLFEKSLKRAEFFSWDKYVDTIINFMKDKQGEY